MSRLIRDVIKNQPIVSLPPDASVREAAREMARRRIGAVVVVDGSGRLAGIFTERDGLFRVLAEGLDPETTPLERVMSTKLSTIAPDRPLVHALHIMHDHGFRHLPVVRDGQPIGMLSIRDALDHGLVHFARDVEKRETLTEILR